MGENQTTGNLAEGLNTALARVGMAEAQEIERLTGGATMESWRFTSGGEPHVLRRAPSLEFMNDRPFGHDVEAAVIRAAHAAGVRAPEVILELDPRDGIGSGFVMRALPGTPDPRAILAMETPEALLGDLAVDLAKIHALDEVGLPDAIPTLDYAEGVAVLRAQFEEAGGDRPIIALGLKWLMDNLPAPISPVLNHGDYRLGNILAEDGRLTGVLDWELAHFGDPHEDLAFGCMAVWRFARYDRPALGLGSLEDYFAAYEAAGGVKVDRGRFRFWTIYRTVWWALGCLRMAKFWRDGSDRMLERVVISRRTSEQELDLLMLLEEDAPEEERALISSLKTNRYSASGEATFGEVAIAVSEWLTTIKDKMEGHDRFQLAVARNALGIIGRESGQRLSTISKGMTDEILSGQIDPINEPGLLHTMHNMAIDKVSADSPKYPALAVARKKWTGEK
ncbi:phosphotransferase [Erythrobacter sp. W53]|uniref:phosphotransferase n=1 Tax=Erythrobacter sp. W53 TaxID=3425947 RepID=UPI003D76991D